MEQIISTLATHCIKVTNVYFSFGAFIIRKLSMLVKQVVF